MVEIRLLTQLDGAALKKVITGYAAHSRYTVTRNESEEQITIQLQLTTLTTPYIKRYDDPDEEQLRLYHNALGHGLSFGAFESDEMVGVALAEPHVWNRSLWVWEFHVAENYRGQGIGRKLMDKLIEKGTSAGLRTLVCETQNANVPAINFYRKMGFVLDGIDLSYYSNEDWPDGEVAVFMKRKLP